MACDELSDSVCGIARAAFFLLVYDSSMPRAFRAFWEIAYSALKEMNMKMKTADRTISSFMIALLASMLCAFGLFAMAGCSAEEAADMAVQEVLGGSEESSDAGDNESQDADDSGKSGNGNADDGNGDNGDDGESGGDD